MDFLNAIKQAGVVGAGGAGFPSHIKFNSQVDWLIVNGVECEPLLETDKYLMRTYAEDLIDIIEKTKSFLGAKYAVIGIKEKNTTEIKALSEVVDAKKSAIDIHLLGNYYPAGDEQILVREVCGKTIPPAGLPLDVGAIVSNVATLLDVKNALEGTPVIERVITVTGEVKTPILLKCPIGTSIAECIACAGGVTTKSFSVILGGPIMGQDIPSDKIAETFVTKTLGGIVVVSRDSYLITMKNLPMSHIINRAKSACIQCRMCTDLCPRYLNGHPLFPHRVMQAIGIQDKNLDALKSALICCECGVCELYACPMGLSPKTVNQFIKKELSAQGIRFEKNVDKAYHADAMMDYRKISTTRMMARTDLCKYQHLHPNKVICFTPKSVTLSLKQHIGQAAKPIITNGAIVKKGALIASVGDKMGAELHASISGVVTLYTDKIVIEKKLAGEVEND